MDVVVTDPVTGKATGLARTTRRAVAAMGRAHVPYCVVGAAALAARGLPRMTRDLDLVVLVDDAARAIGALKRAGLRPSSPVGTDEAPESMIVFVDPTTGVDVDLLVAAGDPEATAIERATRTKLLGASPRVATLESLLLLYLYSNQPKHRGDFAAIVQSGRADLTRAERTLATMHPEMLRTWKRLVEEARSPAPAPPRPPPRGRRPRRRP